MASKFLDSTGLDSLWSKICTIFAPKWLAYKPNTSLGKKADSLTITFTSADSTNGPNIDITIPAATETNAGLLTPEEKNKLTNLESDLSDNETYVSKITPVTTAMPSNVGGILAGTKVEDLSTKKTYSEMFDDLLFPTINPTITGPSASLAIKSNSIREIGSAAPSSKDDFTVTFNRGSIVLLGVSQGERAGTKKSEIVYHSGYEPSTGKGTQFPSKMVLGENNYYCQVSYNASTVQPKDNKGNNYDSKLPAGTVTSGKCTVYGTYPVYATTSKIGQYDRLTLTKWSSPVKFGRFASGNTSIVLVTQPELKGTDKPSELNRQGFLIPNPSGKTTTVKIEWYNTSSGQWDNHTDQFTSTGNITKSINGNNVNYKYYYYNSMTGKGDREFRITITF
jgi:hypothetical protein